MDNSIYITVSRQLALSRDMDVTANNIANMNTTGYEVSHSLFNTFLTADDGRGKISFANDSATYRDTTAGSLRETSNPLDVAIGGEGYFMVDTPQGRRYTRAGNFQIDSSGTLITQEGYPVLDTTEQRIQFTSSDKSITIGGLGNIVVDGEARPQIAVVNFANPQAMQRRGERMYATDQTPIPADNPRVVQGALENGNAQPVTEMTHMIDVQRNFDETAKFIQIMYDIQNKHVTAWTTQNLG